MANNQIALLAQPAELDSPYASQTKALQLRQLMNAGAVQEAQMTQQRQDAADQQSARAALQSDPTGGAGYLEALGRAGNTKGYFAAVKANQERDKADADTAESKAKASKAQVEAINLRTQRYKDALGTVQDREGAAGWVQAMYSDPEIGKVIAQELGPVEAALKRIPDPATDAAGFARWKQASQLGAEKLAEMTKPVLGTRNLGGTTQNTATDPLTGAVRVTDTNAITQSPDSVASNARIASEGKLNRANQLEVQDRITTRQDSKTDVAPSLSPKSLRRLAEMELNGDRSGRTGLGKGAQGAANLTALQNMISDMGEERGISARDITAAAAALEGLRTGMRATGNISARVENAAEEAAQLAPLALAASKEVTRSGFLPFGKLQDMFDVNSNNPALADFATKNTGLATAYASAMARGNKPTVSDNDHARKLLSTAKDGPAYEATVNAMLGEIEVAKRAPRNVRGSLNEEISGKGSQKLKTSTPNTNAQGWVLHTDASGNKAYVSPDGKQYQEVK